jgi:O-antigen ligase
VFLALLYKGGSFSFWKDRSFLLVSLFFILVVLSGVNSENVSGWIHHVKIRLPFLALPLAFYKLPQLNKRTLYGFHLFFIYLLFLSSLPILFNVVTNFDQVYQDIARGRPIETPVNHIKYSIFMAYAIVSGIVIYFKGFTLKYSGENHILSVVIIYLIIFIHILAVRSGIMVLYVSVLVLGITFAYKAKSYTVVFTTLAMLMIVAIAAFQFLPSLNKRVHYMVYDINEYFKNGGDRFSDSDRINSLLIGSEIVQDHLIIGTGIGDIKNECIERYRSKFGKDKYVLFPHNQYLFIAAATGLVGLIFFIIALWGPLFLNNNYQEYLLLILITIYSTSFLVDNVMERSFSAAFFAFFLSSILSFRKSSIPV